MFFRIGRFSKSIDTEKQVCGRCHGKLQLVSSNSVSQKKREESSSMTGSGGDQNRDQESQPRTPKTPNQYALFVKESWSSVKKPGKSSLEHWNDRKNWIHWNNWAILSRMDCTNVYYTFLNRKSLKFLSSEAIV